jgi:hypothetical protein
MLEGMSRAGAGHFYFVESPVQIGDCLAGELGEALEIVARDVAVNVQCGDGMSVKTLNRFPMHADGIGRATLRLGHLASRQEVELVFCVTFPSGNVDDTARALFSVTDARAAIAEPDADVIWTYRDHHANDIQPRNIAVDRAVARLHAAQAVSDALELNRAGRYNEARSRLEATAQQIGQYAGSDPDLRRVIVSLRERDEAYAAPMMDLEAKADFFASRNAAAMRMPDGAAPRRARP